MKDSGYLVFDWREGEITGYHKTKKANLAGHEKRVPVSVEAETPDIDVEAAAGEINVSEGDIRAALGDELVDEPEERVSTETKPTQVVFELTQTDYKELLDDLVTAAIENEEVDETIDWWRSLIAAEHKEMNRTHILEYMEEKLDELKDERL